MDAKELMELFEKRRSIRKYKDEPLPAELVRRVAEAGLMAPSATNAKEVVLVTVTDPEIIAQIPAVKNGGAAFVKDAKAIIVALGDTTKKDNWMEDAAIAMTHMMLMAEALGLGACWVHIRNRDDANGVPGEVNVRRLIGAPEHFGVDALLALGWADEEKRPRTLEEMSVNHEGEPRLREEKF